MAKVTIVGKKRKSAWAVFGVSLDHLYEKTCKICSCVSSRTKHPIPVARPLAYSSPQSLPRLTKDRQDWGSRAFNFGGGGGRCTVPRPPTFLSDQQEVLVPLFFLFFGNVPFGGSTASTRLLGAREHRSVLFPLFSLRVVAVGGLA